METETSFLIFDVGSNAGSFADRYVQHHKVVCVEPNPELAEKLRQKYFGNKNVIVEEVAVSDSIGTISMDLCEDNQMSSCNPEWLRTMRYSNAGIKNTISVRSTTINELIKKHGRPNHIKIDVEGYEYSAVCGLDENVCPVQFEFIGENFSDLTVPVIKRMERIGYTKFAIKVLCGDFDADAPSTTVYDHMNATDFIEKYTRELNSQYVSGMILGF